MRGQSNPPIPIILPSITTKKDKKPESSAHATNIKTKSEKKSLTPPPPSTILKKHKKHFLFFSDKGT